MIIDVSMEAPPYLTTDETLPLYRKLPTASKIVPSREDVQRFLDALDEFWSQSHSRYLDVAVHCHYGFNRTGFLVCGYLIERRDMSPEEAIEAVSVGVNGAPCKILYLPFCALSSWLDSRAMLANFLSLAVRPSPSAGNQTPALSRRANPSLLFWPCQRRPG